jgi:CheY-like chemotaxis protein
MARVSLTLMELVTRSSLRMVHVENDDPFADLIELSLKHAGFQWPLLRCNDGVLALHYFSMIEPDLAPHVILLDLHMPDMNGIEVLHWLRHEHTEQDVAVYLLTSSDDAADRRLAASEGVTEYILKSPFLDKLIQKLDDLIAETNDQRAGGISRTHDAATESYPPAFVELPLAAATA